MYQTNTRTFGVKSLAMGALLFSAGMCAHDAVTYRAANIINGAKGPRVEVAYRADGTFVNGEIVRADGLIGEPRCEFNSLSAQNKRALGVEAIKEQPVILGDYLKNVGEDAWKQILLTTLSLESRLTGRDAARETAPSEAVMQYGTPPLSASQYPPRDSVR